ncbi:RELT 2 [Pelobates cultripes]|uniref:RELT 2 n=1 Tax=Pelobates cultripes TaxID=61616 RepID=A0AAD1RQI1_PELCU|nr:RELT 2 [Pelobates cultripes]
MNEITMEAETNSDVPQQNPFMLFFLVFVFFGTGLIGFLICHVLKKKGYRCRTSPEDLDSDIKEALNEEQENEVSNEDTVERIVKCIIQNEANTEALKQMLGENEGEALPAPSLCIHRESQDAGPSHHHTVHLGSNLAPCMHCTRKKRSLLHRMGRSKDSRGKTHPGEVTVFSVGRFRVTHIGKKHSLQGSQDDTNASSEPISSDKDPEDESWSKSKNGLATQETHEKGSLPLSINGPEMVGLAKMEFQRESEIKCVENNGLKKLENKIQKTTAKTKVSKERRSSAPEQTVTQRQKGNMKIDEHKQKRPIATVNPIQQVSKETSSQKQ